MRPSCRTTTAGCSAASSDTPTSLHLHVLLPEGVNELEFAAKSLRPRRARRRRRLALGSTRERPPSIVLGYGSLNEAAIRRGIAILADARRASLAQGRRRRRRHPARRCEELVRAGADRVDDLEWGLHCHGLRARSMIWMATSRPRACLSRRGRLPVPLSGGDRRRGRRRLPRWLVHRRPQSRPRS